MWTCDQSFASQILPLPAKLEPLQSDRVDSDDDFVVVDIPHRPTESASRCLVELYTDFDGQSYRTVTIDRTTNVLQILRILLSDNHCGDCTNWVIIEWKRALCLWRIVEDHECIGPIQDSWRHDVDGEYNRFVVKQDYCKYEVFRNPKQFFPAGRMDICMDKLDMLATEQPSAQNAFLRNLLSSTNWLPDVDGWLSLREKKAWKKQFFVLRPSGLYMSVKGTSKDPKNLALLCSLDAVHIYYTENGRKTLGAATDSVICVANSSDATYKYICCEDDEMRRNWIVALRLQKYGKQMKENYEAASRVDELLNTAENVKELALQEKCKSLVPMDFSGNCGRVIVENQQEAIAALMTELQTWKKRQTGRCLDSSTAMSASHAYPLHLSQPWYHGGLTREEANRLLSKQGMVDGVFLVRKSRSEPRCFVLSFTFSGKTKHHQIYPIKNNDQICLTLDEGKTKFADLTQLVEFYQLNIGILPTKLTYPLKISESPRR
ncbi:growth factor receptor-bound protein 7-like [Paramacrobiotus metropolitanus]|uniref:growth factor receptor-bound protein 7-like n=1 Tax=Paramacrobiotus metropolitanus TaxID=2943436 RepID=UPI00244642AD|nr:growth factor receptor-bound protein 7-like [Paramacrobiotus metropolitanus]